MGSYSDDPSPEQINFEWELVACAQTGDAGAFGHLYRLYRPAVMRALSGRVNGHPHLAQDLCGDTFLAAWRRIDKLQPRPGHSPVAWFIRIALNKAIDYHKSMRVRTERLTSGEEHEWTMPELRGYMTPDQVAATLTYRQNIESMLDCLNPRYREALRLRYLENMTIAEVREQMGIRTELACKQLLNRARLAAREVLAPAYAGELLTA